MPKPASAPGRAKKPEKTQKSVASLAKGKSVVVNVNVLGDELVQYDTAGIEALASAIIALSDALSSAREADDEDETDDQVS